jgi:hypothetical protein
MPIKINEKTINKISGPVSMYILYPIAEYLKFNPFAPIFILFGDEHHSNERYCAYEEEYKDSNYKIFDINFLQLLSNAVDGKDEIKENNLVDFYVEGGDMHLMDIIKSKNNHPIEEIWELFTKCYSNERMGRYPLDENKENCNMIKNIRWQSGDIRFFQKESKICDLCDYLLKFIKKVENKDDIYEKVKFIIYIRYYFLRIKYKCRKELQDTKIKPDEIYDEYVINTNSLIYKQLIKIKSGNEDEDILNRENIEKEFKEYINFVYKEHFDGNEENLEKIKYIHKNFIDLFKHKPYSNGELEIINKLYKCYNEKDLNKYIDFLMMRGSMKADLYTLARNYKIMAYKKSIDKNAQSTIPRPLINICYFGNLHIEHMNYFLKLNKKYLNVSKVVFDKTDDLKSADEKNRCLDLTSLTPLDIDGYIKYLKKARKDYIAKM